jgi:hypothetical protein
MLRTLFRSAINMARRMLLTSLPCGLAVAPNDYSCGCHGSV